MRCAGENWREREQVLADLSKALGFSAHALEVNRAGRLAAAQFRRALGRFVRPLAAAAVWIIGPFGIWAMTAMYLRGASLGGGLSLVWNRALHPAGFIEDAGWLIAGLCAAATLASICVGLNHAAKTSFALYFDLLERAVVVKEGRIEAAEGQVLRKGGRDPVEHYYFDARDERFPVSREAFSALDSGAAYCLYLLPRSRTVVSIEPRLAPDEALRAAG